MKDYLYSLSLFADPFKEFGREPFRLTETKVIVAPDEIEARANMTRLAMEIEQKMQESYEESFGRYKKVKGIGEKLPDKVEVEFKVELIGVTEHLLEN